VAPALLGRSNMGTNGQTDGPTDIQTDQQTKSIIEALACVSSKRLDLMSPISSERSLLDPLTNKIKKEGHQA
jgi:hypothetical protein